MSKKKTNKTQRKKGSNKRKNAVKSNNRSLRIKQAEMEKRATKRKNEGDHFMLKGRGNNGRRWNKSLCKITCRNKKHGGK